MPANSRWDLIRRLRVNTVRHETSSPWLQWFPMWTVRVSNPGGSEICRTRPDQPWGPPSTLYNGKRVTFTASKAAGRDLDPSPTSSAEVAEKVDLYSILPPGFHGAGYRVTLNINLVLSYTMNTMTLRITYTIYLCL